jgi:NTE family protein
LVLSGGSARDSAHIGLIEELEKHGFEIISISGTSMGALIYTRSIKWKAVIAMNA